MKKTMLALLPVLFLLVAFNISDTITEKKGNAIIVNAAVKSRIDSMMKSFVDSSKTMGLSALIFEKGKEVSDAWKVEVARGAQQSNPGGSG